MATKNYTTRTASLRATIADVRVLDAKKIILNGEDITTKFGFQNEDYKKLVSRTNLNNLTGDYILYTDMGNPVYSSSELTNIDNKFIYQSDITNFTIDTSNVTSAQSAFEECKKLEEFDNDCSQLTNANSMFYNCKSLKSFSSPSLSALNNGRYMFYGCENLSEFDADLTQFSSEVDFYQAFNGTQLDKPSALNVIEAIKLKKITGKGNSYSYDTKKETIKNRRPFAIGLNSFLKSDSELNNLLGTFDSYENVVSPDEPKGYVINDVSDITLNALNHFECYLKGEDGKYFICLIITWTCPETIVDNTFDEYTSTLTHGYKNFFKSNNLTTFSASLASLVDGSMMFAESEKLTSFTSQLPSLVDGGEMFRDCKALTSFSIPLPSLSKGRYMFFNSGLTDFNSTLTNLTDGTDMFKGCKLTSNSVSNIITQLQSNTATEAANITIGVHKNYQDNEEFHTSLGITVGTTSFEVTNSSGAIWTVTLEFN